MSGRRQHVDALVIGAGVGGVCAAARLAKAGRRTLLVERTDRVGGRASTVDVDGFLVNTGAAGITRGGALEETCRLVGAEMDLRAPKPMVVASVGGRFVNLAPLWRPGLSTIIFRAAGRDLLKSPRKDGPSMAEWLERFTSNQWIHGLVDNLCKGLFGAPSAELPAAVLVHYFAAGKALKRFGFCPQGTIGVFQEMANALCALGGEIWLTSEVQRLHVQDGQVVGATVSHAGDTVEISCDLVVSNAGPSATVEMCGDENFPTEYLSKVADPAGRPTNLLTVNFASRKPLTRPFGLVTFGSTRSLFGVVSYGETCPEMAPEGWHLYAAWGVPDPVHGDFDVEAQMAALMQDLNDQFPGFGGAKVVSTSILRDEWPGQRRVAGTDLLPSTPIPNLWNVGDGVKDFADVGTDACARTAENVVNDIISRQLSSILRRPGSSHNEPING